ncbi:MAG TPA: ubiquitin-like domain-containing protein [Anaerolineae bacterium]|nr:ubiquitin-like domain-containing protein [Anaerolineae bacterium]HQK13290.1 ubiquitin-like domain-containing protein [Anaerolineae bacterium]
MNWFHKLATFVLACLALVALTAGYRATAMAVTVTVDSTSRIVRTHQPTVALLLTDLGLSLRPEDRLSPSMETPLRSGLEVRIERAKPVVIVVDGRERLLYAHQESAADLLALAGITLDTHDSVQIRPATAMDPPDTRFRIVVERAVQIVLEDGGMRTTLYSNAATVGAALYQAGIQLYRADRVYPDLATPLQNGMHIRTERSIPVAVHMDGHVLRTRTHRNRVGEVLADLGVTLNGQDYTTPALDAPLGNGGEIYVHRVTESVVVEQSPIPYDSVWQADPDSEIDTQRLLQEGAPGVLERRIRLRYEDGQVVDRWVEGESVVLPPTNRVMGYGTKIIVRQLATESGVIEYWRVIRMLATSYSAGTAGVSPSSPYYGRTATGMQMRHGIVAVDPNVIPLRTQVYVPGYGIGYAGDTGGAIRGRRIDLGFDDSNLQLWYRWVDVYLLTPVPDVINYFGP